MSCLRKIISLIFVLLTSYEGSAKEFEKILSCFTPVMHLNPNFQQGSEFYIDVFYNRDLGKSYLLSKPSTSPPLILYLAHENKMSKFDLKGSTIYLVWITGDEKVFASLVYLGDQIWGAVVQISEVAKLRDPSLGVHKEVELYCRETQDLLSVL